MEICAARAGAGFRLGRMPRAKTPRRKGIGCLTALILCLFGKSGCFLHNSDNAILKNFASLRPLRETIFLQQNLASNDHALDPVHGLPIDDAYDHTPQQSAGRENVVADLRAMR